MGKTKGNMGGKEIGEAVTTALASDEVGMEDVGDESHCTYKERGTLNADRVNLELEDSSMIWALPW
eukprot:1178698-Prorocentrum_minimum.AAC.2